MPSSPSFSVEFFPPKDSGGEERLWQALDSISQLSPDYVSVTYGAGGSTRERTIRVTGAITKRTGIATVAHLTCVGATEVDLRNTLNKYSADGIDSILALRGDPEGGPKSPWVSTPGGFDHADQLVSLAVSMGFEVGVAAFPDSHPASMDYEKDIQVLIEKERRGATYATTQFFFTAEKYIQLVERLRASGSNLEVIPGVLPITNAKQLERMSVLTGAEIPAYVEKRIVGLEGDAVKSAGIEIAIELCNDLLKAGAPGIHFYTMNNASATVQVAKSIGLR
ncbi:MAG: methylenetetrahydrofolate reductase [NAD(P)H] [Actinomycetales bacterium]